MSPPKKNMEYYLVVKGFRLRRPIIYSSWLVGSSNLPHAYRPCTSLTPYADTSSWQRAKTHIRIAGFPDADDQSSKTFEEAIESAKSRKINCTAEIASCNKNTTPEKDAEAYYAVAYGKKPGIYHTWKGQVVKQHLISCLADTVQWKWSACASGRNSL